MKQERNNLKRINKLTNFNLAPLGWFVFLYYSTFFLIGIYALQSVWLIIYAGLFPSIVYNLIYAITWIIVYPFSAFMVARCLIKNYSNKKSLKWFSFLWLIGTFWAGCFFCLTAQMIMEQQQSLASTCFMHTHIYS